MSTEKISAYAWPHGGAIICEEEDCSHREDCANHESANDFRKENGPSPFLSFDGGVQCSTKGTPGYFHDGFTEDDDQQGAITISDLGQAEISGSWEKHLKKGCASCSPEKSKHSCELETFHNGLTYYVGTGKSLVLHEEAETYWSRADGETYLIHFVKATGATMVESDRSKTPYTCKRKCKPFVRVNTWY